MSISLNDTCRFWMALAANPDFIDDPEGLRHPLADLAAHMGMSPSVLYEACRGFQKMRADRADQRGEDSGVGGGLDFESLQPVKGVFTHFGSSVSRREAE